MSDNEKLCYFAHHVTDYGTEREQRSLDLLEENGFTVENPNTPENDVAYQALKERGENPMAHFEAVVRKCGALAFQRFESGFIGAGVGKEIRTAALDSKPIFEVLEDALVPVDGISVADTALSVDDTRAHLKEIREARVTE